MMTAECWVLIPHIVLVVLLRLGRRVTRGERREETEYNWEQLDNWQGWQSACNTPVHSTPTL